MIYESVLETIGNTPLIHAARYERLLDLPARLLVKMESRNPAGSAKDRVALSILKDAMARGVLKPGGTVIEATSGNTGVGLAMAARVLGCRVILTMPESMSIERRKLLSAFGAELALTPAAEGMAGANKKAETLASELEGSFLASQFDNPANPAAHEATTGPEIWRDTAGRVDALVATVGTGGTLSGTARYLKTQNPQLLVFAVEPAESPMIAAGRAGAHGIQGIGANFIPENYDPSLVDEVLHVTTNEAKAAARAFARAEGILCGISSGAALAAAAETGQKDALRGKRIVAILPDTGERYLSSSLYE